MGDERDLRYIRRREVDDGTGGFHGFNDNNGGITITEKGCFSMTLEGLRRIDGTRIEVPQGYKPGMRVKGVIYVDEDLEKELEDQSIAQVANVATLPGIVTASMAMPDIHTGYGFAIGGVAAFDLKEGIISPGGVGYDIN
jgi:hypothetical protein